MQNRRLVVMIPAYNEEASIGQVIKAVPRNIPGVAEIKVLVVDDGSTDQTVGNASEAGADTVVSHSLNRGLAATFTTGLHKALERGADIIVNIDADGQYVPAEIERLIGPILSGEADIVIGNRQIRKLAFMPVSKKYGNLIGSWVVRGLSGAKVSDASSGFRAFSAEAAAHLNVFSPFTYTHETIIDAASKGLKIAQVPCTFLPTARPGGGSRLIASVSQHIKNSAAVIIRTYVIYKPLKAFFYLGSLFLAASLVIGIRFLYFYFQGLGQGKIQSLILGAVLAIVGFQIILMGFLADAVSAARKVSEELLYRLKALGSEGKRLKT